MASLLLQRVDGFAHRCVPALATIMLVGLSVVPLPIPDYAAVTPALALASVYHWTIYRPELMPPISVFLIGLVQDLLNGAPLGLTCLILLATRLVLMGQRRFFVGRMFPFVWGGFVLVTAMAALVIWAIMSLLTTHLLDPRSLLFQAVLSVAIYPILTLLFLRLQRLLNQS